MISHLRGTVFSKGAQSAVVEVNGVGYALTMPTPALGVIGEPGEEAIVFVSLQVRDDGVALFGFADEEERMLFEKLISVSGVGPKAAISVMSCYAADDLMRIIASGDSAALSRAPGIGKKTAQRIVIDLKGAFDHFALPAQALEETQGPVGSQEPTTAVSEATQALLAMGFTSDEARVALEGYTSSGASDSRSGKATGGETRNRLGDRAGGRTGGGDDVREMIRYALKRLGS